MGRSVRNGCIAAAVCLTSGAAHGATDVTLLTQQRSITAATPANGGSQTVSAPDFAPFVQTLSLSTSFMGPAGPVTNVAVSRIDCQIDPNAIRARGSLAGAGGTAATGEVEIGDAKASIFITFQVNSALPFSLLAAARPALHPTDDFLIELKDITRNNRVFVLDAGDPPAPVNASGMLQPGQYWMKYRVEGTFDGAQASSDFGFNLTLGCRGDFNGVNGLTVQDLFDFLSAWFAGDQRADFDGAGGIAVADIFAFLEAWFAGCV